MRVLTWQKSGTPSIAATGSHSAAALRSEAQAHLDFAIGEFRAMKMQPALEQALRQKDLLTT
jgi:hypothetical protein